MDDNMISVPCAINGCDVRVVGDVRCQEHGGDPIYEWQDEPWGTCIYRSRISRPIQSVTGHPLAAEGAPS